MKRLFQGLVILLAIGALVQAVVAFNSNEAQAIDRHEPGV